ncbi:MAG: Mu transposase C-terminal domain-containing protein [Clostridiaceae bacterium]|nr:Mu transposase C-terminal domain-containing protein [Clostridiaceae bacterium]
MNLWITTKEAAEIYEVTERTIQRKVAAGDFEGKTKMADGVRKNKIYLIDLYSLPIEKQRKYFMEHGEVAVASEEEEEIQPTYTLGELKEIHGDKFEKYLEEALKKKEAVMQFSALSNGAEGKEDKAKFLKGIKWSGRALYQYKEALEKEGLVGLIRKPRKNKGKSTKLPEEAVFFIRGCFNQPIEPKKSHVVKMYRKKAKMMGWPDVSQDTIYREIKKTPKREMSLARDGKDAFEAEYVPSITRTYEDLLANEYWVGDGHTLAIWTPDNGRITRYTMSAWMDMRTRAFVGFRIARNSSSEVIATSLRSGIMEFGLPGNCYMDNGLDYKSGFLNAEEKEAFFHSYNGVFSALDIGTTFAIPYNAKAKPIERFFRTFSDHLSRYMPGFCGESIEDRPHNISKKEILVKNITIKEVFKFIEGYREHYNNSPHSGLGGKTPMEVMASVGKYREDMPSEEELDMLMMRAEVRKINKEGIKKFGVLYWDDTLWEYIGEGCVVRYDPNKIGELYVYINGKLICKATNKELLSMKATQEEMKRWGRLKAEARKATKEALNAYGVTEEEVKRLMLEDYVDEETLDTMLAPKKRDAMDNAKVVRLNQTSKKGLEKKRFDTEKDNEGIAFYEKLGEEELKKQAK